MRVEKNNDYRNTENCPILVDVALKKCALESRIQKEHRRAKIMYNYVHDKQAAYFAPFSKIYNSKCAYCGVMIGIIDIRMFEVDHFVCEDAFPNNTAGRSEAGKVSNLVLSCYSCNRGKGKLAIDGKYKKILNPDEGAIAKVFMRDENYYIKIRPDYTGNYIVTNFYDKLLLGSEFRRLDYLLMEIENLISMQRSHNSSIAEKLEQCFSRLIVKRNKTLV